MLHDGMDALKREDVPVTEAAETVPQKYMVLAVIEDKVFVMVKEIVSQLLANARELAEQEEESRL